MIEILTSIDEQILLFFNGLHTPLMNDIALFITGKLTWLPFYIFLLDILVRKLGPKKAGLTLIAIVLAILLADQICASLIRPIVARLRPCSPDNPISQFIETVNGVCPHSYSWPSCHAANTFALATLLSIVIRSRRFTTMMVTWAVIVSLSRLYMGVHYPTDLLCGAAFGSVLGYFSLVIVTKASEIVPKIAIVLRAPKPQA